MTERLNKFGKELGELLEFQNISINDYADRIGTTSKNLIDIIEGRVSLSFNMICNISFISDIPVSYITNTEENFKLDNNIDNYLKENGLTIRQYINKYNYKELESLYGVVYNNEQNDYSIARSILKYLRIIDPKTITKEDNYIFYKSKNHKPELLALWLERCYRIVQNQKLNEYNKDNIVLLVDYIRNQAKKNVFNKEKLIKEFNNKGIFLAIELDLKGSKVRGAFRVLNSKPAIYITTKHKRIADIYFALLHELAHCKSDYNRAKKGSIISFMNENEYSDIELKADNNALNWMVPNKEYKSIIDNNNYQYEIMSFLVYRLALDKRINYNSSIYQKNNVIIDLSSEVDRKCIFEGYNTIYNNCRITNCLIGMGTYVHSYSTLEKCKIGRWCSIAPNVSVIIGNHPTNLVSTHPIFYSDKNSSYAEKKAFGGKSARERSAEWAEKCGYKAFTVSSEQAGTIKELFSKMSQICEKEGAESVVFSYDDLPSKFKKTYMEIVTNDLCNYADDLFIKYNKTEYNYNYIIKNNYTCDELAENSTKYGLDLLTSNYLYELRVQKRYFDIILQNALNENYTYNNTLYGNNLYFNKLIEENKNKENYNEEKYDELNPFKIYNEEHVFKLSMIRRYLLLPIYNDTLNNFYISMKDFWSTSYNIFLAIMIAISKRYGQKMI